MFRKDLAKSYGAYVVLDFACFRLPSTVGMHCVKQVANQLESEEGCGCLYPDAAIIILC